MTTEQYLLSKGHLFYADPIQYRDAKKAIITESIRILLKRDYGTQDLISQYVNRYFETFNYSLSARDHMEKTKAAELHYSQLGWSVSKRLTINDDRLDEVCYLFALTSMLGSAPLSPGDVTMNSFRYYDVVRLLAGGNFNPESTFELTDDTEMITAHMRYEYFRFIAIQLKPSLPGFNLESLVGALYHCTLYQLAPVLAAAFRSYESDMSLTTIRIGWPVLETKEWSDYTLNNLLHSVTVGETPEWLKIVPLVSDLREFLSSKLGEVKIALPVEINQESNTEIYRQTKMIGVFPKMNASILEYFESTDYGWLISLVGLSSIKSEKAYMMSYNVSIKGYYMAEDQLIDDVTLLEIYKEGVLPSFESMLKESFGSTVPGVSISTNPDNKRIEKNRSIMMDLIAGNEAQIFRSVLDYSERRILLNNSLIDESSSLPLYYSFAGGRISFENNEEG